MRKNYLIVLVLFSILLGGCNHGDTTTKVKIKTNTMNTGWQNNNLSGNSFKNPKFYGLNDPLNLLHLENSGKHLLSAGTYLLKDTMVLNEKLLQGIQQFQKLGSGLTEIEKNELQKTLENYQKNLELQKEFMKSWLDRQKCMQKIYNKLSNQQNVNIKQNQGILKHKVKSSEQKNNQIKQEDIKEKSVKVIKKPTEQKDVKSAESSSQVKQQIKKSNTSNTGQNDEKAIKNSNGF